MTTKRKLIRELEEKLEHLQEANRELRAENDKLRDPDFFDVTFENGRTIRVAGTGCDSTEDTAFIRGFDSYSSGPSAIIRKFKSVVRVRKEK